MSHAFNVDTAGRNVRRNQRPNMSGTKGVESSLPRILGLVTVNCVRLDAGLVQVTGDTVGAPFKDTSGPALNILMKLMAILSLVFAQYFESINGGKGLFKL